VLFRPPPLSGLVRFDRAQPDDRVRMLRAARERVIAPRKTGFGPVYWRAADNACVEFVRSNFDPRVIDRVVAEVKPSRRGNYRDALDSIAPVLKEIDPSYAQLGRIVPYLSGNGRVLMRAQCNIELSFDGVSEIFCWIHWSAAPLVDRTRRFATEVMAAVAAQSSGFGQASALIMDARRATFEAVRSDETEVDRLHPAATAALEYQRGWEALDFET
jgi:hypothetical protein